MEAFLDFERRGGGEGRRHLDRDLRAVDADRATQALLDQIDEYNREDCIATLLLRDWLLERRDEALAQFGPFPPPEPPEPKPVPEAKAERAELRGAAARRGRGARGAAARLPRPRAQAGLVGVLRPDRDDARGAARGRGVDRRARAGRRAGARSKRSLAYTLAFPPQEHKLGVGQQTCRSARPAKSPGEIIELDREARTARAQARAARSRTCRCREALIPGGPFNTPDAGGRARCASAARCSPATAATRRSSRSSGASRSTGRVQTTDLDEMKALVLSLDGRHLVIQGPPGLGQDVDVRPADRAT